MTNTALWHPSEPDNRHNAEDCAAISFDGIRDVECNSERKLICQQKIKSTHCGNFQVQSNRLIKSVSNIPKCVSTATVQQGRSVLQCARHCAAQPLASCYAFYYNKTNGSCVLVMYSDVTLSIEIQPHWMKYISLP